MAARKRFLALMFARASSPRDLPAGPHGAPRRWFLGPGTVTWCAGDEITEMHHWGRCERAHAPGAFLPDHGETPLYRVTVIAADGVAVGGGLEIIMACGFVASARRARLRMPGSTSASFLDGAALPAWSG